ncbi:hypothetical protein NDU88_009456 [Pleurodeles waltl]|uniref:Uncharacterized protein n=1 Tax=Pleurodeles waltl TaxID=8319 RepID=A0AAV7PZ17_PLEWA|nr:hypothetical protein NDU88_009456 [Pleurodeles waltl]
MTSVEISTTDDGHSNSQRACESYINDSFPALSMDADSNVIAYGNHGASQCSMDKYTPYQPAGQLRLELKLQQVFMLSYEQL